MGEIKYYTGQCLDYGNGSSWRNNITIDELDNACDFPFNHTCFKNIDHPLKNKAVFKHMPIIVKRFEKRHEYIYYDVITDELLYREEKYGKKYYSGLSFKCHSEMSATWVAEILRSLPESDVRKYAQEMSRLLDAAEIEKKSGHTIAKNIGKQKYADEQFIENFSKTFKFF